MRGKEPHFGSSKPVDGGELTRGSTRARSGVFSTVGWLNTRNWWEGSNRGPEGKHSRWEWGQDSLGNYGRRAKQRERAPGWLFPRLNRHGAATKGE